MRPFFSSDTDTGTNGIKGQESYVLFDFDYLHRGNVMVLLMLQPASCEADASGVI